MRCFTRQTATTRRQTPASHVSSPSLSPSTKFYNNVDRSKLHDEKRPAWEEVRLTFALTADWISRLVCEFILKRPQSRAAHLLSVSHAPSLKLQYHLQQVSSLAGLYSRGKRKSTRPSLIFSPFLALNLMRPLTSTLLHVQTSRRSLPSPRPEETHLTFSPGLPHPASPFSPLASRDEALSAEFSQLKHRQLAN